MFFKVQRTVASLMCFRCISGYQRGNIGLYCRFTVYSYNSRNSSSLFCFHINIMEQTISIFQNTMMDNVTLIRYLLPFLSDLLTKWHSEHKSFKIYRFRSILISNDFPFVIKFYLSNFTHLHKCEYASQLIFWYFLM